MAKFKIVWEERYSKEVEAKTREEAREQFEAFTKREMNEAYQDMVHFEVVEGE